MGRKAEDITGQIYGRLTVTERAGSDKIGSKWKCCCVCGTEVTVLRRSLIMKRSNSCGCLHKEKVSKGKGVSGFNHVYLNYQAGASNRNLIFNLSKEHFRELIEDRCGYCGKAPKNSSNGYIYNGIDRIDNTLGYIETNVITSCFDCNFSKRTMNLEDFKKHIKSIYEHLGLANEII